MAGEQAADGRAQAGQTLPLHLLLHFFDKHAAIAWDLLLLSNLLLSVLLMGLCPWAAFWATSKGAILERYLI